jgi:F0F1-type ATP synthase gamma subunit
MAQMWEKYRQGARPPHKLLVSVYKSMGYSQEFIDKMNKSHERKKILAIKYEKIVNNIFEKPTKKKVIPQKKKKPIEEHEIVEEDEEENDDNEPEEDEAIVVDEDDDEEECVDEDIEPPDAD